MQWRCSSWRRRRPIAALGLLEETRVVCREIIAGARRDQVVVDQIQGGAGISTNMNSNEVIANPALELMGQAKGDYAILHPNEDVNLGQSTNDVYPGALRLATWTAIGRLLTAMADLRQAFAARSAECARLLKTGRTQLQDAMPMTLDQEFGAFATMPGEDEARLSGTRALLCGINPGATAIGTGLTAYPEYAARARSRPEALTGIPLITAPDLI